MDVANMRARAQLGMLGALALAAACLDPLFEDLGRPLGNSGEKGPDQENAAGVDPENGFTTDKPRYAVCCVAGRVDTCACAPGASCSFDLVACAYGSCATRSPSNLTPSCGGGGGDGGMAWDAGGNQRDGGEDSDGGYPTPSDGGVPMDESFLACCNAFTQRVDTCGCPSTGCPISPFTSCGGGTCVPGTSDAECP